MEMMERNTRTNEKGLVKCMLKLVFKLWGLNIEYDTVCSASDRFYNILVCPFRKPFAAILSAVVESFEFSHNILGCSVLRASNELLCMRRGLKI
jgi:hypothetical protein